MIHLIPRDGWYTQRNNPFIYDAETKITVPPWAACMPTARVMWYNGNQISFSKSLNLPDDAYLTKLLITKRAVEFATENYPDLIKAGYPPNQIHGMYGTYLDGLVVGHRKSDFVQGLSYQDIANRVDAGECVMTSGAFMGVKGPIDGHAYVFAGLDDDSNLLICDPYGDYRTNYVNQTGWMIPMPPIAFEAHTKPLGPKGEATKLKWGHVLLK